MAVTGAYAIPFFRFCLKHGWSCYINHVILLFAVAAFSISYMAIVSMIIHGSQSPYVGNFVHGRDNGQICAIERM